VVVARAVPFDAFPSAVITIHVFPIYMHEHVVHIRSSGGSSSVGGFASQGQHAATDYAQEHPVRFTTLT
jgi:hypothetical protein